MKHFPFCFCWMCHFNARLSFLGCVYVCLWRRRWMLPPSLTSIHCAPLQFCFSTAGSLSSCSATNKKTKQKQNKTKQKNWNVEQKRVKVIFQSMANWIFYSFLTFHYVSNYNFFVSLLPYPISHVKGKIGFGFAQMVLDLLLQLLWLPYTILIVHRPSDRHYSFILTRPLPNIINTRVT